MQKPLAIALFLAIIFMPYAPLVSFPAKAEASNGDITYFDNPGSSLWTVPANVHKVTVKVWGAGAAAGNGEKINNHNRASLGGGAGGYTEKTISVTPGQTYLVDVGAGGHGILSVQEGRLGQPGQESKFEGNGETLRATGGSGGATAVGFGNPMDPIGFGGIGDGGNDANNQGGGNSSPATWDGDNWDASNGGSAYAGGNGGSRGRLGRDGQGHCGSAPCDWAQDGQFPGGGGGGSDTGAGGYGANGRVTIEEVDAKPYGFVDAADCSSVGGWAYDSDEPSVSIGVHFYADGPAGSGTWLGNTIANTPRPDINAINIPGNHGYSFTIPDSLKDGQTHKIYTYGINSNPSDPNNNNAVLISSADNVSDYRTISGCTTVVTPTDVCPNIAGVQATVPTGYYIAGGICLQSLQPSITFDADGAVSAISGATVGNATRTIQSGQSINFSWASYSTASCSASGAWSGSKSISGSETVGPITQNGTYTLTCTGSTGLTTVSNINVVVLPPGSTLNSVSITVNPNPVVITSLSGLQLAVTSTASVTGSASLTNHGVEVSVNGGAFTNAGAWNNPVSNTLRSSDASFTSLNLTSAGTYVFRTYGSIDGVNYVYSSPVTVPVTVNIPPTSTLDSVSIAATPNPAVIPNGGSVQLSVTSTANVTGPAVLTNHGIEARLNGGAWVNAGAWNNPVSNTLRSSDASFTSLNISVAGSYEFRTYASINNGTSYVYSNIVTVPITGTVPPTTTINSVSIAVTPNPITIPFGGSVQAVVTSTANVTGPGALVQHGIEMRVNGGAWTTAGNWTAPVANTLRTSDVSFTSLNLTTAGTYDFRTFGSLGGLNRVDSNIVSVVVTVGAPPVVPTLNSVSIAVTPNPVVIPNGGNVQLVVTSTSTVSGGAVLTNHGVEVSVNGGAFTNAGAWPSPVAGTMRTSDASFTSLNLTTAGTYAFRTYGSINNGTSYVYSSTITVPVTVSANHAPVISGVVGPTTGLVNTSYLFTATATDQDGDNIEYGFDWNNNGTIDTGLGESWAAPVASGVSVGRTNSWTTNGAQSFQVLVRDSSGASSSFPVTITISGGATNIGFTLATSTGGFSTSEAGGTAVFTVVLNSAPLANVTLPITSSDFTEGTTSVTSLLFTTTNWNVPQQVIILGVDDSLFDGNISYNVTVGPSTSSDINYNNLAGQSLLVVNTDNEINVSTGGSVSSFSVNPTVITSGNSATLTWTASNATLCVASGSWSGNQNPTGGSLNVGPYVTSATVTNTYAITCGNANGTTTQSLTLTIAPTGGGGGGSSGSGGGSGTCYGFGCPGTTNTTTVDPLILLDTPSSGGSSNVSAPAKACPSVDFITTFLRAGIENNPNEVKKLQYFLNKYDGRTLEISGVFDTPTEDAVKAFQVSHANEVLTPWNTDVPTGIVYITTTAAINRIFCADNPTYSGDNDLKDILNPVLYTPVDNSSQFEGVIGAATSSTSTNIASVFGAISGDILGLLKGIPWYELLILLLILLGSGFIVQGIFKKDITSPDNTASFVQGISMLAIGSVLNVLNTLSFMIKPDWFTKHIGMNPSWLLGIDAINLLATVAICLCFLIVIHRKLLTSDAK